MSPSYIGAVWMFGGNFAPVDFAFCDGSLQSIAENATLFNLLGTTYGGDGQQTFGLPDLRGRAVISQGQGPGLSNYVLGQKSGNETVTLTTGTMAGHSHWLSAGPTPTQQAPTTSLYVAAVTTSAGTAVPFYSNAAPTVQLVGSTISATGNNIPFDILQPFLVVSYVIALYGIYPSQN
jgi:microcystin-dependent protein